jgi:hypothetical protein
MRVTDSSIVGVAAALAVWVLGAGGAGAAESCREWREEHRRWKSEALRLYLSGAPQRELDTALFELLQREAYLTSCEVSVEGARADLVGWRLVGRVPDEYAGAVIESVLERGGFDLDLRRRFANAPSRSGGPVRSDRAVATRRGRGGAAR